MRRRLVIAAVLAVATPAPVLGQDTAGGWIDGNELHDLCQYDANICSAYVVGVVDGMLALARAVDYEPSLRCISDGVTVAQLGAVVKQWLENNPAERHYSAPSNIGVALGEAWPCD